MPEQLIPVCFLVFFASGLIAKIAWALAVTRVRRHHRGYWESVGRPGIFVAPGFLRNSWRAMAEQGRAEFDLAKDHRTLEDAKLDRLLAWRRGAGRVAVPALVLLLLLVGIHIASSPPN